MHHILQLSSLYEVRPPVSRAKMAQVTKCAIKAIKFYKHVVQSVEKFIQKVSGSLVENGRPSQHSPWESVSTFYEACRMSFDHEYVITEARGMKFSQYV